MAHDQTTAPPPAHLIARCGVVLAVAAMAAVTLAGMALAGMAATGAASGGLWGTVAGATVLVGAAALGWADARRTGG